MTAAAVALLVLLPAVPAGGSVLHDAPPPSDPPHVASQASADTTELLRALRAEIDPSGAEVGLYYRGLGEEPDSALLNPDLRMHAASTMKVPVMMRLFLDREAGRIALDDRVEVRRTFRSIVDDTPYEMPASSDSEKGLHERVGGTATVRELIDLMITRSSNLATNILVEEAGAERTTAMLRELGADSMEVLRGVQDLEAYRAGLSNTTTARDLGVVMRAVAGSDRFAPESREEMLGILERQHYRDNVPAGVPEGVRVANKTGWITGIDHDAAVVFPPDDPPYVLVVMIRDHPAPERSAALAARLSRIVWEHHTGS